MLVFQFMQQMRIFSTLLIIEKRGSTHKRHLPYKTFFSRIMLFILQINLRQIEHTICTNQMLPMAETVIAYFARFGKEQLKKFSKAREKTQLHYCIVPCICK